MRTADKQSRRIISPLLGMALLTAAGGAYADDMPLSIDDAVARALADNHSMLLARTVISAKKEDLVAAQRAGWPTLGVEVEALREHGKPTSFFALKNQADPENPSPGNTQTGNYGVGMLNFSAPLYQNGALFYRDSPATQAAQSAYSKAEADSQVQGAQTANLTAKAYLGALSAAEVVAIQSDAAERLGKRVNYIHSRVSAQVEARGDELLANAVLADQLANLNSAQRAEALQQLQLVLALGLPAEQRIALSPLPERPPEVPAVEQLARETLADQPTLRSQQASVSNAKAQLAATDAQDLPKVSVEANVLQATDMRFHPDGYAAFGSVGLKVTMPLLDFGNRAQIRARNYELEEAKHTLNVTRDTLVQSVYTAYYAYSNSLDKIRSAQKKLDQLEYQQLESTKRFEQHLVGLDAALNDEATALNQRVEVVQSRYAAWDAYADLLQSMGRPFTLRTSTAAP